MLLHSNKQKILFSPWEIESAKVKPSFFRKCIGENNNWFVKINGNINDLYTVIVPSKMPGKLMKAIDKNVINNIWIQEYKYFDTLWESVLWADTHLCNNDFEVQSPFVFYWY
tara:strand:- start:169 stop:504 length:336 start_codon:yes stop_codon:yes gene_type:complete